MGSCIEVWCPFCSAIMGHAWEGGRKLRCACLSLGSPAPPQLSWVRSPPLPQTSDHGHAASPQLGAESSGKLWKALEWWATVRLSLLSVFSLRHNVSNHKARDSKEFLKNHFNIKFKWMFTVFNCVYMGAWVWAHDVPKSLRSARARVTGSCEEPGMGTGRTQVLWS